MRYLTNHIVDGDSVNHQLRINILDEPGQGGACHAYRMEFPGDADSQILQFQNGPIKECGVNGVTQEALLAIVIDRLWSFQSGPFSCRDNAIALTHCEEALMWLQRRTRKRIKRGVEGTNQE